MKIVIVGGQSSLGRALKPILLEFGEVITAGRKNCDIKIDLKDPLEKINLPNDSDVIIHTAALFGGKTAEENLETEEVNVLGTFKICQAAVRARAKHFILISSIFASLKDDSPFYNIYALSKKQSEEIARYCFLASLTALAILRPSQIYGNEDYFRKNQPFFYTLVDQAEKGEDITLYGSRDAKRNFININDLTSVILRVVQNKIEGTYSCQYPTDVSYSEIARAAIAALKSKSHLLFQKDKPDIPDNIFYKDDSLYKKIGYYPQITIEDGLRKIGQYRKGLQ